MREVAIVHYNTPELTEAAILSLRKHGGQDYHVTVFDNSDSRPFTKVMGGVTRIDNTQGQVVDFDKILRAFPDKDWRMGCGSGGSWGSAKHMISVQALWDILPQGFLLLDSDVLIRRSVDFMFRDDLCTVGHIQTWEQAGNRGKVDRLVPMVLWINVPRCVAGGARFFDPARAWALSGGGNQNRQNWYDTGAAFLEDIRTLKPQCTGMAIDIRPLMHHYQGASWRKVYLSSQLQWLADHASLWTGNGVNGVNDLGDPSWTAPANKNARIYIMTHKDFPQVVHHPMYEVVDARDGGDMSDGVPGAFFSELLPLHRVAQRGRLPQIVGCCGYRKYFTFGSNPPILSAMLKKYGCIVSQYVGLGLPMYQHYTEVVGNGDDLDLATSIVAEHYPDFYPSWNRALRLPVLHPASMFVMRSKDFRRMERVVWDVVQRYLSAIGGDIYGRVRGDAAAYHLGRSTEGYQIRVGGQLCERLVSAWIDWQFPDAKQWPVIVTG